MMSIYAKDDGYEDIIDSGSGDAITSSEKIKIFMGRKGIGSIFLAEKLGIRPETFNYHMRHGSWKVARLKQIAEVLGVGVDQLV